jgi:hypothetical protein
MVKVLVLLVSVFVNMVKAISQFFKVSIKLKRSRSVSSFTYLNLLLVAYIGRIICIKGDFWNLLLTLQ